jgi:conjugal transfer pilus assembly protein TraV
MMTRYLQSKSLLGLLLISPFLLTGCATPYGCQGMPDEPTCLSTTEAYQVTDNKFLEPKKMTTESGHASGTGSEHSSLSVGLAKPSPPHQQPMPKIDDPTPIRKPAQVMRIWIAPWEDSDGDLMVSNYVYTELEPRRWMIGKAVPLSSPSLIPLQIEQRPPEKAQDMDRPDNALRGLPTHALKDHDKAKD